jgi:hypothetical protein
MRVNDGGYGGKIAVDPTTLTQAAGRLKPASQELQVVMQALGSIAVPSMPGDVAAVVQEALSEASLSLGTEPSQLDHEVTELTRRAWWAEYADALWGGYTLSGAALAEFKAWMKDGTLLQYADEDEAELAGKELGIVYSGFRKDPQQLIDLAATLKACENDGTGAALQRGFGAGFVNQFGAKNMEAVPRVIQAMEWDRAIAFSNSMPPNAYLARDVAVEWLESGRSLHQDPIDDLLMPFSILLANATYSTRLNTRVTDDIANSDDTWATATLISHGTFSTPFLRECFQTGVVDKIVQESMDARMIGYIGPPEYALGQMWSGGKEELPYDTKQIVLDAVARNPDAAYRVLSQQIDVKVFDKYGQQEVVTRPIDLIYQYGRFHDGGASLGNVFSVGEHQAYYDGGRQDAGTMTLDLIDNIVNHDTASSMSNVPASLAGTLSDHYMHDLHESARNVGQGQSFDPDGDGIPGSASARGIDLSKPQLTSLLSSLLGNDGAREPLLHGVTAYQANAIRDGIAGDPAAAGWQQQIGAFDGTLNTANEAVNVHDVQAAQEREQQIASALDDVVSLVPLPHGLDIVAGHVPELVASGFGPHGPSATDRSASFHDQLLAQMKTSIAAGYVSADPGIAQHIPQQVAALQKTDPPYTPTNFLQSGHIIPWGQMSWDQQQTFTAWFDANQAGHAPGVAVAGADNAFFSSDEDQTGN